MVEIGVPADAWVSIMASPGEEVGGRWRRFRSCWGDWGGPGRGGSGCVSLCASWERPGWEYVSAVTVGEDTLELVDRRQTKLSTPEDAGASIEADEPRAELSLN